jgi:adenylate kinase family enzyme
MSSMCRLHVIGASGSGTTTLGRALATLWSVPHADADDYFWIPTAPPFMEKRPVQARLDLMQALFLPRDAWVLSGSTVSWGDQLRPYLDAVVFLTLDQETRVERLRQREAARYGDAIAPGGSRADAHRAFIDWACRYDDADFDGRSRVAHEEWLSTLSCPVLRLDGAARVEELTGAVEGWIARWPTSAAPENSSSPSRIVGPPDEHSADCR